MVGLISRIKYRLRSIRYSNHKQRRVPDLWLEDIWGLDGTLADLISRCLKEFKEMLDISGATPGIFYQEYGDRCWDVWSAIIEKMIYAFDTYAKHAHDLDQHISDLPQEEQDKIQEGMHLFIKYFKYLNY